jgi:hypothetical protein
MHCKLKYSRKVVQIIDSKARKTRAKTRKATSPIYRNPK